MLLVISLACESGSQSGEEASGSSFSSSGGGSSDTGPDRQDLEGDYDNCSQALAALGYTEWTGYTEYGDAAGFQVELEDDGHDEAINPRPWYATLSLMDEDPGYRITCADIGDVMWVDASVDDYWSCAFQADYISILDPEADPTCSLGFLEGNRVVSRYADAEDFVLVAPGHLVLDE